MARSHFSYNGGTLLIGATDDGEPVCLEEDCALVKAPNADGFVNRLDTLFETALLTGRESLLQNEVVKSRLQTSWPTSSIVSTESQGGTPKQAGHGCSAVVPRPHRSSSCHLAGTVAALGEWGGHATWARRKADQVGWTNAPR